jgi:hypothetical protein
MHNICKWQSQNQQKPMRGHWAEVQEWPFRQSWSKASMISQGCLSLDHLCSWSVHPFPSYRCFLQENPVYTQSLWLIEDLPWEDPCVSRKADGLAQVTCCGQGIGGGGGTGLVEAEWTTPDLCDVCFPWRREVLLPGKGGGVKQIEPRITSCILCVSFSLTSCIRSLSSVLALSFCFFGLICMCS